MNQPEKILLACPETFGDVLICTGIVDGIKQKWPEAKVYFATQKKHFEVLLGNPQIEGVLEYHESMLNYRAFETWGPQKGLFDIVFNPYIITQRIPHWIHGGHGPWLGQAYANMCNVEFGTMFLAEDDSILSELPAEYITVQSQTRTDPKDWDYFSNVLEKISGLPIIHLGAKEDKPIKCDFDLRGKTTIQQVASVIKNAKMHLGGDSFLMHIAGIKGTPSVIVFGGTYKNQGYAPCYAPHIRAIETQDRGLCVTSCHLLECEAKKAGFSKCINNIPAEQVLEECRLILGDGYVEPLEEIKISSYLIIKDGIKYGFPFKEAIRAAAAVSDEVVVVDGGSNDDTMKGLLDLTSEFVEPIGIQEKTLYGKLPLETSLSGGSGWADLQCGHCGAKYRLGSYDLLGNIDWKCGCCGKIVEHRSIFGDSLKCSKIKIHRHEWDMDCPTLFGDEKTYARELCTGTHLIQLDCDEIISEPYEGAIRDLIRKNRFDDVLDLPCINFYENTETIRIETNAWKWRISRNDFNILHGVHKEARKMDPETARITMDKRVSDGCEYIYDDSMNICKHKVIFDAKLLEAHEKLKRGMITSEEYMAILNRVVGESPVVFHYSWLDLGRKAGNGAFWDNTWFGKNSWTHNSTKDISKRISNKENEILIKINFEHPLKFSYNEK